MDLDTVNRLAIRYKNIWRGGPTTEELREHLTEMDANRAENMLTSCARRLDHPPTIAQLWREYEATRSPLTYGWTPPDDTGPPISLNDYRQRHDDEMTQWRDRHPSSGQA